LTGKSDVPAGVCEVCGCPRVRWLRVGHLARQFGCTDKVVRRMIRSGVLDAVRLGHEWRVDHESLDDYVRRESVGRLATDDGPRSPRQRGFGGL